MTNTVKKTEKIRKVRIAKGESFLTQDILNLIHSASTDETRHHLSGIYINLKDCEAVATDGHQIAKIGFELPEAFKKLEGKGFIIGVDTVKALKKIEKNQFINMNVQLEIDLKNMKITVETIEETFTHKLIEGDFPNYKQIIPNKDQTEKYCLSPRLIDIVRKSFGLTPSDTHGLVFHIPIGIKVAGEAPIIDSMKPCIVTYGNSHDGYTKEAVIMPMRM